MIASTHNDVPSIPRLPVDLCMLCLFHASFLSETGSPCVTATGADTASAVAAAEELTDSGIEAPAASSEPKTSADAKDDSGEGGAEDGGAAMES